jgi:hypothetical protein
VDELTIRAYVDYWMMYTKPASGSGFKEIRRVCRQVLGELGGQSFRNVALRRAWNEQEVEKYLTEARRGGRRVIVYTAIDHVVGLRPVSRGWKMVGNELPVEAGVVLTPAEIFPYLVQPKRVMKGRVSPNIVTFGSERRRQK